jgi:phospholipid/cholesterol/gamma-HCH transport system ATP-binding protein
VTIAQEIVELRRRIGVTSLVVTHDRDLAFGIADRMAIIQEGNILFTGTPAEMKRHSHPSIQRFLNAEFKIQTEP